MPYESESNIAPADALSLLLHNQHALGGGYKKRLRSFFHRMARGHLQKTRSLLWKRLIKCESD